MSDPLTDRHDDPARAAARAFADDVAMTVDVDLALRHVQRAPARRLAPALTFALIAVLALVAAVVAFGPDDDAEVAVDEDATSTTVPDTVAPTVPDVGGAAAPIVLGSADDGKDSVGLPVSVDPATGLLDGQTVTVTGSGFPPGEDVGVVMCTREAGADYGGRGVDACNIGHFAQGRSDEQGQAVVQFDVRRLVLLDGQEVDCASEPGRCIIGMGMISDYDQSGGVAVDFDPSVPLPDPPTVELAKTTDIADGETVAATITGLVPGSMVYVSECTADGVACAGVGQVTADSSGSFDGGIRLWRTFGTYFDASRRTSPNADCAVEACQLRLDAQTPGDRAIPPVPISFDPARGGRQAPTVALSAPGPFHAGDTVAVTVTGVPDGSYVDVTVCGWIGGEQNCFSGGPADPPSGGEVTTDLRVDAEFVRVCADAACFVTAGLWHDGPESSTPPQLFPEPVPLPVEA